MNPQRLLVGDIGGTHCRLALAHGGSPGEAVTLLRSARFRNAEHRNLASIVRTFLADTPPPRIACLAVAGPTDGQRVQFTNLDWQLDATQLARDCSLGRLTFINDFSAVGWGLNTLRAEDCLTLQTGTPDPHGIKAAIGAGTGLGVSLCVPQGDWHRPLPSEGGHIGFAPVDAEQDRLLLSLRTEFGRVSMERLVSGPGLEALYRFARQDQGWPAQTLPAAAISAAGFAETDPAAVQALRLFVTLYGQVAGDIALVGRTQGGVYLAGGIAPQLQPLFTAPHFLASFRNKGRFSAWMHSVPVHLVLDPDIGLKGAAVAALVTRPAV